MSTKRDTSNEALPEDDRTDLVAEFASLQKQQWEALDRAIYVGMAAGEARAYEGRARRITELQRLLGTKLNIPPEFH